MANVYELADQFREELINREYKAVRNVLRAYEGEWKQIKGYLDQLTTKISQAQKAGVDFSPSWLYQQDRYRVLLEEINSRYSALAEHATEFVTTGSAMATQLGASHAYKLGKAVIGEFAGLPRGAIEEMIGLFSKGPVRMLFADIGSDAMKLGSKVLIDGLTVGKNPRVVGRELAEQIEELTKYRATLIARTEMLRSYRMSTQRTFQTNNDVLAGWRWACARTQATCSICYAMDGEFFPLDRTLESHPACRCSMIPETKLAFGEPIEVQSAEDYFKALPEKIQNRRLGRQMAGMYRRGEITLKDTVRPFQHPTWGRSYRKRTLAEIRSLRDAGELNSQIGSPPLSGFLPAPLEDLPPIKPAKTLSEEFGEKYDLQLDGLGAFAEGEQELIIAALTDQLERLPSVPFSKINISAGNKGFWQWGKELDIGIDALLKPGEFVPWAKVEHDDALHLLASNSVKLPTDAAQRAFKAQRITLIDTFEDQFQAHWADAQHADAAQDAAALWAHAEKNFDLLSANMYSTYNTYGEAYLAYKKGLLKAGDLPEALEKEFRKVIAKALGKKSIQLKPALGESERILGLKIGEQAGSNPGGMYLGRDGIKRYVKFYGDPQRAHSEQVANEVYRALGVDVPNTTVFTDSTGKVAFASDIVEGLAPIGNNADAAKEFFSGFVADVFLANWDAAGLQLDNALTVGGKVYRIDAGGSLLFRAQGSLKPYDPLLNSLEEWGSFFQPLSKVSVLAQRAGYSSPISFGKSALEQIGQLEKWMKKAGMFHGEAISKGKMLEWVRKAAPGLTDDHAVKIANMLANRAMRLIEKREWLKAAIKEASKPVKVKAAKLPAILKNFKVPQAADWLMSRWDARKYKKLADVWNPVMDTWNQLERSAMRSYKGSGYGGINRSMRTHAPNTDAKHLIKMFSGNKIGVPHDIRLKRRLMGAHTESRWDSFTAADVGTVISDRSFISTSSTQDWSWSGTVELYMDVRAGDRRFLPNGRYEHQTYASEAELLGAPDIRMLITKVEKHGNITRLYVEVLPEEIGRNIPDSIVRYTKALWKALISG